jgi:hypothetical protein
MEQPELDKRIATNKRTLGCFGWGAVIFVALLVISSLFPESSSDKSSEPTATQSAATNSPEIFPTSGCTTITGDIYDVSTKLAGLNTTYTISDVAPVLLEAGETWGTWAIINEQDGNPDAAEWLNYLSESALKLRVSLLTIDAAGVQDNSIDLLAGIQDAERHCP